MWPTDPRHSWWKRNRCCGSPEDCRVWTLGSESVALILLSERSCPPSQGWGKETSVTQWDRGKRWKWKSQHFSQSSEQWCNTVFIGDKIYTTDHQSYTLSQNKLKINTDQAQRVALVYHGSFKERAMAWYHSGNVLSGNWPFESQRKMVQTGPFTWIEMLKKRKADCYLLQGGYVS